MVWEEKKEGEGKEESDSGEGIDPEDQDWSQVSWIVKGAGASPGS